MKRQQQTQLPTGTQQGNATKRQKTKTTTTTTKDVAAKKPKPKAGRPRKHPAPVSFYAIQSSNKVIEEPIIFFSLKDLQLFENLLKQVDRANHRKVTKLAYKEFNSLVDAMEFVQTAPKEKKRNQTKKSSDGNQEPPSDQEAGAEKKGSGRPRGSKDEVWEENFRLLIEYKIEHGHFKMPSKKKAMPNPRYHVLIAWARQQRKFFSDFSPDEENPSLTDAPMMERRRKLQNIGFELTFQAHKSMSQAAFDSRFQKRLDQIKEFKEKHGHANIPQKGEYKTLYSWLLAQRKAYHASRQQDDLSTGDNPNNNDNKGYLLTLEHVNALKELGVSMEQQVRHVASTREYIQAYVDFVKTHERFPLLSSPNDMESRLARRSSKWRAARRSEEEEDQLPQDLMDALDSINFNWTRNHNPFIARSISKTKKTKTPDPFPGDLWETNFQALKAYIDKHGFEPTCQHLVVGKFVEYIQIQYDYKVQGKRTTMTTEQFQRIADAGFQLQVGKKNGLRREEGPDSGGESGEEEAMEAVPQGQQEGAALVESKVHADLLAEYR